MQRIPGSVIVFELEEYSNTIPVTGTGGAPAVFPSEIKFYYFTCIRSIIGYTYVRKLHIIGTGNKCDQDEWQD